MAKYDIYTLSLHDALPIYNTASGVYSAPVGVAETGVPATVVMVNWGSWHPRSEEHTSELQSRFDLVCRLLLEKKKFLEITDKTSEPRFCYRNLTSACIDID